MNHLHHNRLAWNQSLRRVVCDVFVPDVAMVWRKCHRVLRSGGELLAGFVNPAVFMFGYANSKLDPAAVALRAAMSTTRGWRVYAALASKLREAGACGHTERQAE